MGRYTGPKLRVIRRLGLLPGFTAKLVQQRVKTPGQHGKVALIKTNRYSLKDDYKECLLEKQKLRFNYGITEKQLIGYCKLAKKNKEAVGTRLLELLETRLDCIVYRLGFSPTIPSARQVVSHGHILVNFKPVNIPSFSCQKGDKISVAEKLVSKELITKALLRQKEKRDIIERRLEKFQRSNYRPATELPSHLEMHVPSCTGKVVKMIRRKDVLIGINDVKVLEFFSR